MGIVKTKGIGTSAIVAIIVAIAVAGISGYFALKGGREIKEGEEEPAEIEVSNPAHMLLGVEYEREDWATTNVGEIDHLIYMLALFDEEGNSTWVDGHLTLKIKNAQGEVVSVVERDFAEEPIGEVFRIEDYQIGGPIIEAKTYTATYVTVDDTVVTDLVTFGGTVKEKEITGPHPYEKPPEESLEITYHWGHFVPYYSPYDGWYTVVGEVQNRGTTTLTGHPSSWDEWGIWIRATFYDKDGTEIDTTSRQIYLDFLLSGEKSPFKIESSNDEAYKIESYDLSLTCFPTDFEPYRGLEAVGLDSGIGVFELFENDYAVTVEVRNVGKIEAFTVDIIGTFYDAEGKMVYATCSRPDWGTLWPGEKKSDTLWVPDEDLSQRISSYRLQVQKFERP